MSNSKVAIVTGAGSGIGRATAIKLAKHNYRLTILGRRLNKLEETAELCYTTGLTKQDILCISCDILIDEQVQGVIRDTIAKFDRIDLLVNNAGFSMEKKFYETALDDFDLMYKLHARAPIQFMQLAYPHLKKTKGNIVNVSSIASDSMIVSDLSPYTLAKATLNIATKLAAKDYAKDGKVRVNVVLPGITRSDLLYTSGKVSSVEENDKICKEMIAISPLNRIAESDEVAAVIYFLANDETSSNITGTQFDIAGGLSLLNIDL